MAQENKTCSICSELGHSKFYCKKKPLKPLKRTVIARKVTVLGEKPKKKPKTANQKAKDAAWDAFSAYIRTRDCLRFTGDPTEGMCVTCKNSYPYKRLQAGHFISGRGNAVLFDERVVFTQCYQCNGNPPYGKGGNYVEYFRFMLDEVGLEKIDEYRHLKGSTMQYKLHHFQELEVKFKLKRQELLK